jgi:hypothetical protein
MVFFFHFSRFLTNFIQIENQGEQLKERKPYSSIHETKGKQK